MCEHMYEMDLLDNTENVNRLLARYGVKFGIYKNNTFKEQLFPFDAIPRVIQKEEFDYLERWRLTSFLTIFTMTKKSCGIR